MKGKKITAQHRTRTDNKGQRLIRKFSEKAWRILPGDGEHPRQGWVQIADSAIDAPPESDPNVIARQQALQKAQQAEQNAQAAKQQAQKAETENVALRAQLMKMQEAATKAQVEKVEPAKEGIKKPENGNQKQKNG